jgi:hypothetical protein
MGVVDEFEPVHIDEQHSHSRFIAARSLQRADNAFTHHSSVRQARQAVMVDAPGQVLRQFFINIAHWKLILIYSDGFNYY